MTQLRAVRKDELLSEPSFIGREQELAALCDELAKAEKGEGRLVFVEALSGRGKSRLVREFIAKATPSCLVLEGQGVDQGVQRPFQLLVGPAQQLMLAAGNSESLSAAIRQQTGEWHATLCSILPELRALYPDEQQSQSLEESFGEERSLRALLQLLTAIGSSSAPALVILDDCQWADEMALKLLAAWSKARQKQNLRYVMILAAFRTEEVTASHPLRSLSPDAAIRLDNFPETSLRGILLSMAEGIPEEAMRLVTRLSGGSPFMAATVLRGLVELGILSRSESTWSFKADAVTEDMAASDHAGLFLKRRIELLSPDVVKLLKVSAILGKEFDAKLASTIADCSEATFEEAQRRHMIRALGIGNQYTFVHDKLREALLDELSAEERRLFCLHIAHSVEERDGEKVFDLAYFFGAAEQYNKALPYALRAAEEARARASLQIAEQQYRIALKGLPRDSASTSYRVFKGLGEVLTLRGKYEEALELFAKARECASNELESASVEGLVCDTIFKTGDTARARDALREGLGRLGVRVPRSEIGALFNFLLGGMIQVFHTLFPRFFLEKRSLRGSEKNLIIGQLLNQLAYANWFDEIGILQLFASHFTAFNLLEKYPPTTELAHTYSSHAPGMCTIGYYSRAYAYSRKALDIAKKLKSVWGMGQAYNFYGCSLLHGSRFADGIDRCLEAAKLLERAGDLWELNIANCNIGYNLYYGGNLPGAIHWSKRTYQESIDAHDTTSAASCLSVWSKSTLGDLPLEEITRLRAMLPKSAYQPHAELGQAEALYWASRGDIDRAIAILDAQYIRVKRKRLPMEYVLAVVPWLVTMLRLKAEQQTRSKPRERKRAIRRGLRIGRGMFVLAHIFRNHLPQVSRDLAFLYLLSGKPVKALRLARKSLRAALCTGSYFNYAQSKLALGKIQAVMGLEAAIATQQEAKQLLEELHATETLARLEVLPFEGRADNVIELNQFLS